MGATDKLIARVESQAETLAELRRLEEKHRGRICELERKLGDAEREQDIARVEIETLRQERDLARAEIMTWRVSDDSLRKDRDHWKQARQDAIEAGELMQAEIETLRQQLDAAQAALTRERLNADEQGREIETLRRTERELTQAYSDACQDANRLVCVEQDLLAEIDTLRQQLANAQREAVNLQKLHDHLRPRLDAAQGQLTRERLDAEERGEKLDRLHEDHARLGRLVGTQRHELERLRTFVATIKAMMAVPLNGREFDEIGAALDELDSGTTEPTPVAEPLDAEGNQP